MRPTIVGPEGKWTRVRLMLVRLMGSPVIQPPTPTPTPKPTGASATLKTSLAMALLPAEPPPPPSTHEWPYVVVPNRRRRPKREGLRPQRCSPGAAKATGFAWDVHPAGG
ncbi:hypothetical protein DAI22_02g044501 [Oryza sativa Japonica Group]|nr:hypothetical protein DAI22_02g044501 [Oryza sativa Japonica Group]